MGYLWLLDEWLSPRHPVSSRIETAVLQGLAWHMVGPYQYLCSETASLIFPFVSPSPLLPALLVLVVLFLVPIPRQTRRACWTEHWGLLISSVLVWEVKVEEEGRSGRRNT